MSYQPLIPTGTVKLSVDYANIQGNFQSLDTIFNVDHVPYSNTTPQKGFHKCVHLNAVSTVAVPLPLPVPVPLTGEIFSAQVNDGINTDEQLFFQSGDNGFLTNLTRNFQPVALGNGATFLPGGLIVNYGTSFTLTSGTFAGGNAKGFITFTQPFPSNIFSILFTLSFASSSSTPSGTGDITYDTSTFGVAPFTKLNWTLITNSTAYTGFSWMVIGK